MVRYRERYKNLRKGLTKGKGKYYRKVGKKMKPIKSINIPHTYKRTYNCTLNTGSFQLGGALTAIAGGSQLQYAFSAVAGTVNYGSFSLYFQLQDLPSVTEFTTLYDSYKVTGFKMRLIPYNTMSATGAAATATLGQSALILHHTIDLDDATLPAATEAGIEDLRQYQYYKVQNLISKPMKRYVKPRTLLLTGTGAGAITGSAMGKGGQYWFDIGSTGIQFYGVKGVIEGQSGTASAIMILKVEVTAYFQCKYMR